MLVSPTTYTEGPVMLPPITLFWSTLGEVACAEHAPPVDDPRWTVEGWNQIPITSVRATHYQCQHCASDNRSIVPTPYLPTHTH